MQCPGMTTEPQEDLQNRLAVYANIDSKPALQRFFIGKRQLPKGGVLKYWVRSRLIGNLMKLHVVSHSKKV